ncbi:MAG: CoA transferase [Betaproteobacteria bacterium]|jgi:crotonobetainyl-CoA:carnitine CoA-transferase CaiB-like acyl-CoA transferase|nr:CoA transferase [Betaproteobacteria bacterium]
MSPTGRGPLAGLRVIELSTVIAGPFAASLLADFGADVIKISLPASAGEDPLRTMPPHKDGKPLIWKVTNRNKRSVTLDLRKPAGRDLFLRLLGSAAVLIENFRPGTLDRWGLDKKTLWDAQPGLTILRVTGFGQNGPYRNHPGFARLFEAYGGLTYITGEADGPPLHPGYPIGDPIGGAFGALGVVAALYHRALHPDAPGQEIDLSLTEAMLKILEVLAIKADQIGETHERIGNENAFVAPAGVFRAADGHWVTVTCASQSIFERFCTLLGRPEMIRDARFANNAVRMEHRHELNAILGGWVAERRVKDVVATLMEAGVSAAPVYDARQILEDPHFTARAAVTSVEDRDFGAVKMPGLVPRFSHTPGEIRSSGPEPGAHNDEVYRDLLGLSPDELEQLRAEGVV